MRNQRAFTMVEIIMTLLLLGVIGVFSAMFYGTFVQGYLTDRLYSETSMKAQIALDRMSLELSQLNQAVTPTVSSTGIQFTNISGSTVSIAYAAGTISLNGNALISGLQSFSAAASSTGNSLGRYTYTITFNISLEGVSVPFSTTVYPAN